MKRLLLVCFTLLPLSVLADSEAGLWGSVSASKSIGKKWGIGAEVDYRTTDFVKTSSRVSAGLDADYKITRWLKAGAGYSFLYDHSLTSLKEDYKKSGAFNGYNEDAPFWRSKHRAYFDLTGKLKAGRFTLSLRERYQFTHSMPTTCERTRYRGPVLPNMGVDTEGMLEKQGYYFWPDDVTTATIDKEEKNTHMLRSRLAVEYNIRHCPVTPSVSYEIQNILNQSFKAAKQRVTAGIDWKVNKKFYLSFDYIYQHEFQPDENEAGNLHALSIGAKIKL